MIFTTLKRIVLIVKFMETGIVSLVETEIDSNLGKNATKFLGGGALHVCNTYKYIYVHQILFNCLKMRLMIKHTYIEIA